MGKLLKTFIGTIITSSIAMFSTSCEDKAAESLTEVEPIDVAGKVFVDSYLVDEDGNHSAGIETFEFTDKGTFSNRTGFCYLAGNYLTLSDEISGNYSVKNNNISLAYPTYVKTGVVKEINGKLVLQINDGYEYEQSERTVLSLINEFQKLHSEVDPLPLTEDAKDSITIKDQFGFVAENNSKSIYVYVDSIVGNYQEKNREVYFRIENVVGKFRLTDNGGRYLVRIGKKGFATTDASYANENPADVFFALTDRDGFTLVTPTALPDLKKKANPTKFAPLETVDLSKYE